MAAKLNKKQQKVVETMDRKVSMCREFMNDWLLFNQILSAYPSPGVNKAQLENQFLKIKSKLAREHNVLRDQLGSDYKIDSNTMGIVSGATNLETVYAQSEVAVKKLQGEWHRSFISINETLGAIEDKKARAEAGEKVYLDTMVGAGGGRGGGGGGGGGGITSNQKKLIAFFVVVALIVGSALIPGPVQEWFRPVLEQIGYLDKQTLDDLDNKAK